MARTRATIRDVAEAAGVSVGTASRALNRTGAVSRQALDAVNTAAKALSYEPDLLAKSLRGQAIAAVGVLVSDIGNPLYSRIFVSMEQRLQREGYAVLLSNTHNDPNRELQMVQMLARYRVAGVFVGPCAEEHEVLRSALSLFNSVVSLDRDIEGVGDSIKVDHFGGAYRATRHLLNLGHRRIALLTPGISTRPGRERIAGFTTAFSERGMGVPDSLIRAERSATEFSFSEALGLLSSDSPPTAFVCLGTRILAGVLKAIKQTGLVIPEQVSVIGIGDNDLAQLHVPEITSLGWDLEAVGVTAAEMLLKRRENPARALERVVVTPEVLLRESSGPISPLLTRARRPA